MANWKRADIADSLAGVDEITDGVPIYRPESGPGGRWADNWVRILPPRADAPDGRFYRWVAIHFIGAEKRPVVCPRKMFDESCPACAQGRGDGNERKGPRWVAIMNVISLNEDGTAKDGVVRVWPCPRTAMDDLRDAISRLPADGQDITDPETGRPVLIRKKGTGMTDTRYQVALPDESFPLGETALLEGLNDLTTTYEVVSPEQMVKLLTGPDDPFQAAGGTPRLRAALPAPVDDDDDDPPVLTGEVIDPEEEPAPAPRRVTATRRAPTEEEKRAKESLKAKLLRASTPKE